MRFALLGSGSRGNAMVVEQGRTRLLIDCGFPVHEVERRLGRLGIGAESLSAILVTHEHSDHIQGAGALARRYKLPLWMTHGTAVRKHPGKVPVLHELNPHADFTLGELQVHPFPVPHDAREPCQFVFSDGRHRLGLVTDLGHVTAHVLAQLEGCDALVLETNHDAQMLAQGPYPPSLKARVAGRLGHLSNAQAAELLGQLELGRLQHLVAAHLSEQNNTPALALAALEAVVGGGQEWLSAASQDEGLDWRQLL